jgi:hypothetical protein
MNLLRDLKAPFTLLVVNDEGLYNASSEIPNFYDLANKDVLDGLVLRGAVRTLSSQIPLDAYNNETYHVRSLGSKSLIEDGQVLGNYISAADGNGYYLIDRIISPVMRNLRNFSGEDIMKLIARDSRLSQIRRVLEMFPEIRRVPYPFTLFLPNNDALHRENVDLKGMPPGQLLHLLRSIIIFGELPGLLPGIRVATLEDGNDLYLGSRNGQYTVNGAQVIGGYNQASRGQGFYVLDDLPFPPMGDMGNVWNDLMRQPESGTERPNEQPNVTQPGVQPQPNITQPGVQPQPNVTQHRVLEPQPNATQPGVLEPQPNVTQPGVLEPQPNVTQPGFLQPQPNVTQPRVLQPENQPWVEPQPNVTHPGSLQPESSPWGNQPQPNVTHPENLQPASRPWGGR